ncbi:MAG: hypothetical protein LLG01_11690 [Planctomycetaceae bacterium]|nr:hypothetical protein [Planctomycetaceae bacterium]
MRWVHTIRKHLPRRKRLWRYVSLRRQGAGLLIWLAMIAMIYGYWRVTNNDRVCKQAAAYLRKITGAHVTIDSAEFNLFGPIELNGVRIFTRDPAGNESSQPLLAAASVVLQHRPWPLLFQGRVSPSEIRFVEPPDIVIEHYSDVKAPRAAYNFQRLGPETGQTDASTPTVLGEDFPRIYISDCHLRVMEVTGNSRVTMKQTRWNIAIEPRNNSQLTVTIEPHRDAVEQVLNRLHQGGLTPRQTAAFLALPHDQRGRETDLLSRGRSELAPILTELDQAYEAAHGGVLSIAVDVSNGAFRPLPGSGAWIPSLVDALPKKYQELREQFAVEGRLQVRSSSGRPDEEDLEIELLGASLQIPSAPAQASTAPASRKPTPPLLTLRNVRGVLKFDAKGLSFQDVTGQIREAGDGRFRLSGRYGGFELNSPFHVNIEAQDIQVPRDLPGDNALSDLTAMIQKWYAPIGTMNLEMRMERPAGGSIAVNGSLAPRNMSFQHLYFPYRAEKANGTIEFNNSTVRMKNITCQRNGGRTVINGTANLLSQGREYDVTIQSEEVPCDADLREALPRSWREFWGLFSPQGLVATRVRVHQTMEDPGEQIEVDINADGRVSMEYGGFPYRLDNLIGSIHAKGGDIMIEHLRGRRGKMQCRISGFITGAGGSDPQIDVAARTIEGYPMALDAALLNALSPHSRALARGLNLTGSFDAAIRARRESGQPLHYSVSGDLSNAAVKPEAFPYAISQISAHVEIGPDTMVISDFQGRHGEAPITLAKPATVYLTEKPGASLEVATGQLPLDMDLYTALPPAAARIWDYFSPAGQAAMSLSLRYNTPMNPGATDYALTIVPRGGRALCRDFPAPLSDISGQIVAAPGRIVLNNVAARSGSGHGSVNVNGTVTYNDRSTEAALSVQAQGIDLTASVLAAMPRGLGKLAGQLHPGGTVSANLSKLNVTMAAPPAAAGKTSPAAAQQLTEWSAAGAMSFQNALIQMGLQDRHFSGGLSGSASYSAKGLSLDTQMSVDRLLVGSREITNVQARLMKNAATPLVQLKDFCGEAYGGKMAGQAEIKLADSAQYAVSLSVEDVRLEDLVRIETPQGREAPDVAGLLTGNIQVTGELNNETATQASGVVRISKAKILKLPVMLGLLRVITLNLPGESAFTDGNVVYRLKGKQLVFDEIYLSGPAMTIVGSGRLNMETRALKLRFLSGPHRNLPRLQFLEGFFKGMMGDTGEIDIDGTIDRPEIKTIPMRSLDTFIKQLLRPDHRDGE